MQDSTNNQSNSAAAFRIFAILWAYVHCMELVSWPFWMLTPWGWFVFFGAGWVLLSPGSVPRFAIFLVASVAKIFHEMPFVPNHILFTWMINLTILGVFVFHAVRNRWKVDGGQWFEGFAPLLRVLLIALYLISGVQKLNRDYLDPSLSCAAEMFKDTAAELGIHNLGNWVDLPAIYGSLVVEWGIPALMIIPRTRLIGIAIGFLFHAFLAFHPSSGVYGFSTLMFILFLLFLPGPVFTRLANARDWPSMRALKLGNGKAAAWLFMIMLFAVIRGQVWFYFNRGRSFEVFEVNYKIGLWFWIITTIWFVALVIAALRQTPRPLTAVGQLRAAPVLLALILPLVNATMPWVGCKTQTSFSMFSNLRTEFGENHLFLRRTSWFGFQDELVRVVSSEPDIFSTAINSNSAQQYANTGDIVAMFELRRLANQIEGPLVIEFTQDGVLRRAVRDANGNVSGVVEVFDAPGFLARKFLWFRRHVTFEGPMHCTH